VMREAGGFAMGPFALMDLIGLDVNLAVSRSVHAAFHGDARYAPALLQEEMVAAGWLGRKSGRGFYDYREGAAPPRPAAAPRGPTPDRLVVEGDLGPAAPLIRRWRDAGIAVEERSGAGVLRLDGLCLALTDGRSATARSREAGGPVVLLDLAADYATTPRLALAAADQAGEAERAAAAGLLQAAGIEVAMIDDRPGLLVMRTVARLASEAADVVHTGVAAAAAVDTAMRLGTSYPKGPLAWAEEIGLARVVEVLGHLAAEDGSGRYRASPLLRRKALAEARFGGG
jgi:3-hydroxybutyryl-CoA dehydrogenase